jgi:hypothetical protein
MNVNVNQYIAKLAPWNFSITLGETRYPMRRARVGDLAALMAAEKAGSLSIESLRDAIDSLFMDPKPDLAALDMEILTIIANQYVMEFQESTKKNGEALGLTPPPKK